MPSWLTVSPTSGSTGETTVNFSAPAALDGRTAEILLTCNGATQRINVIQGVATVSNATCAEVNAGPDSKTYRVTGTVTNIVNTTYGNWYLEDATGSIYIYGTLDAKGGTKNFLSWGLEVGDEITVEGPKTTYHGTVELLDVTVIKINKSLIKVAEMDPEEAQIFLEEMGLSESGLARLAREAYHLLGLQSYFTSGEKETKAWTIPIGAKAPQAAGVIHTDFERGFIKAETASYEDYVALGGEKGCRDAGKLRQEGKEYVVQDGDVMHFKFNV